MSPKAAETPLSAPQPPGVGQVVRVAHGPWRGTHGPVTATFGGGAWVAVRVCAHLHPRTFPIDDVEAVEQDDHGQVTA